MLNTKSMLERHLDVILGEEEKKHPLRFPPSDKYRFAEPNTDENIVYEDREKSNGIPLIKVSNNNCGDLSSGHLNSRNI